MASTTKSRCHDLEHRAPTSTRHAQVGWRADCCPWLHLLWQFAAPMLGFIRAVLLVVPGDIDPPVGATPYAQRVELHLGAGDDDREGGLCPWSYRRTTYLNVIPLPVGRVP